jgi:hypothetical protein
MLVSIVRYAQAQGCTDLKNETPLHLNELVATSTSRLPSRSSKAVETGEEELKKDLLVKLSEKIIVEVQSGSVNMVKEDGSSLMQIFTSETKINSNTKLRNIQFDFCFDDKHKTLFGKCTLNKTGLAESIAKDCISRLIALNAEIEGAKSSGNVVNTRPIIRSYESISRDFQTALFINFEITTEDWNKLVTQYNKAISEIAHSDDNINLKSSIEQAHELMAKDQFQEALLVLKRLNQQYKLNDDIEQSLQQCYDRYLATIRVQAARMVQLHDYSGAQELVDEYCSIAICSSEAKALRTELRTANFHAVSDMLVADMKAKDDLSAASHFNTMKSLADILPDKANELTARYQQYKIDRLVEKARIENEKRNYWEAYSLLKTTELTYGVSTSEIKNLKASIFKKIARQEISDEKKTRPHINSFAIGPEMISNEALLSEISDFEFQSSYLGFAAGIYFKHDYGDVDEKKGYPVASDLIGIKARFTDYSSYVKIDGSIYDRDSIITGHLFDIGLDGSFVRIFHYNVSAVYNQDSHFDSPLGMSASFGVRIPIARIALGVDGRYFNNLSDYTSISAVGYIQGYFDFNRKFTRADKRKVRARLKEY